jgi:hypothetical protein
MSRMSDSATTSDNTEPNLRAGDALAEAGDWPAAIEAWSTALKASPGSRDPVQQRLTWFLGEAQPRWNRHSRTLLLVATATLSAILATVFVLIPDDPGARSANMWAIAAWIMIAVATVLVILAARGADNDSPERLLKDARNAARKLDSEGNGHSR